MGTAINTNQFLLESVKEIAHKHLAEEPDLLLKIQFYYQKSCERICNIESMQSSSNASFPARILAQLEEKNTPQSNLYTLCLSDSLSSDIANQVTTINKLE